MSFHTARVIFDRSSWFGLPVDVRFAPKATEILRCRKNDAMGQDETSPPAFLPCERTSCVIKSAGSTQN